MGKSKNSRRGTKKGTLTKNRSRRNQIMEYPTTNPDRYKERNISFYAKKKSERKWLTCSKQYGFNYRLYRNNIPCGPKNICKDCVFVLPGTVHFYYDYRTYQQRSISLNCKAN
eukprot:TRINITY_DN5016_c0_g1_i1.p1 TRINITY_DN5016_c0_g1~~TRINITY_DN5016_c0_g1_i1.p1  ORF type:complete len:113 (+),score=9.55 TRINITY_DN5016_c0_g1_i1:234-572(+)